jgi:hypothetical protein
LEPHFASGTSIERDVVSGPVEKITNGGIDRVLDIAGGELG